MLKFRKTGFECRDTSNVFFNIIGIFSCEKSQAGMLVLCKSSEISCTWMRHFPDVLDDCILAVAPGF